MNLLFNEPACVCVCGNGNENMHTNEHNIENRHQTMILIVLIN